MKRMLLPVFFVFYQLISAQQISRCELRQDFLQSTIRQSALDSLFKRLEGIKLKSPVEECYYGICHALQTQYTSGTWAKIKLVYACRELLNDAVAKDPNDAELRFMRLTFEHFLPAFLGLSKDINTDLAFILQHPDFAMDSPQLKKKAIEFLISTKRCTIEQCRALQQQLADLNKKPGGGGGVTLSSVQ